MKTQWVDKICYQEELQMTEGKENYRIILLVKSKNFGDIIALSGIIDVANGRMD